MLLGKHVRKRGDGSVTGFCKAEDPVTRECIVEVMHAPGSVREDRVSASQLEVVLLLPNMRAWAFLEDRWWPGRLGKADSDGTHEWIGSDKALYVRPAGLGCGQRRWSLTRARSSRGGRRRACICLGRAMR